MKTINPLHPISPPGDDTDHPVGATFSLPQQDTRAGSDEATELIRAKLRAFYANEPDAKEEEDEVAHMHSKLSKHQKYMQSLAGSGRSLAEIQTAWHQYYVGLPDKEKHEVWQEFYAAHQQQSQYAKSPDTPKHKAPEHHQQHKLEQLHVGSIPAEEGRRKSHAKTAHHGRPRKVSELRKELVGKVDSRAQARLTAKHHLKSLAFGLSMGVLVILILLFGFFNDRFLAPFFTPSRNISATPIIINPDSVATGTDPKVIIPKINVEIPVVYDVPTIEEAAVEKGLERGVVHYATTPNPGEKGNVVVFGHSSNNILNPGKYKFAFVLLSRLDTGDVFYLQKDGKRYAYKVFEKKIVEPTDISVLDPVPSKVATATLITCDPPGTSLHRLVVVGEQISPDPSGNTDSTAVKASGKPAELPSNAPSLWSRILQIF